MENNQLYEILTKAIDEKHIYSELTDSYKALGSEYKPEYIVYAQNTEEIAKLVKLANEHEFAIYPIGSGSMFAKGVDRLQKGIILSTKDLNKVMEYRPHNLSIEVEAGMTTKDLQEYLEKDNLFYPMDTDENSTIGGQIASNRYGENRYIYKSARFYVLGLEFVSPEGEIVQVGGRTVKNVTGYDISQLLAGSWGNFGIITKATLKIKPRPEKNLTLTFNSYDLTEIKKIVIALFREKISLATINIYNKEQRYYLTVKLEGFSETIRHQAELLRRKYELYKITGNIIDASSYKGMIALSLENIIEGIEVLENLATKYQKYLSFKGNLTNGIIEFEISKSPERYLQNLATILKSLEGTLIYDDKVLVKPSRGTGYGMLLQRIKDKVDPNSVLIPQSKALRGNLL
ncbi:glycolate oxidase [Desulfonispora thiosulfatigenes DSM 11270]|uniref:Glycolate oxidase n=1 Tax=Desulfonispora thiosulfatigenes DSM 11270 TaxID=656914 RepID=A0A1W1UL13_DESTI|nr:FAD-binding oxidoreductase [Desulfonispora thiosulfatigenes]SMB81491.1 glycolate oxidase [Desulfonispora thiosulfatigenes DSM 11270]